MESDYDIPLEEEGTPYVTIEEMKKLLAAQRWYNHKYEELELDEQSGLYFTEYFVHDGGGLLRAHMLVEQCMEHFDELDWKRITNGYDFDIISRIEHLMENPLVWIDGIPDELARQYVVTGRVAEEKSSEERNRCTPYADLNIMLSNERIEWFANQLPTRKDIYNKYSYYGVPKDMILWGLILTDEYEKFSADLHAPDKIDPCTGREYWPYCNPQHFRFVINRINDKFGSQKAAQIVRLLRDDWQDIKSMKLFGIDKLTPERVEEFRQCLFEGMDRNLRAWDAETPKEEKPQQSKAKPEVQQDRAYVTFTMSDSTVGHIDMLRQKLIQVGWIAKDTQPDDFYKLFSGKVNNTKVTWTGAVGKGMLVFLFNAMVKQNKIAVPDSHSVVTILEAHFVDMNGAYLTCLNSSKESPKHLPIIKECLDILLLEVNMD